MRVCLSFLSLCDLPRRPCGCVIKEYVAVSRVNRPLLIARQSARFRRRELGLVFRQLPEPRSIARDDIRIGWLNTWVARLLPLEIDPLAIARPSNPRGLVAVQFRPAHDVVDSEGKL